MRISVNWLKKYIDIICSIEELARQLTMVGFEVEGIERLGAKYERFVVGRVVERRKHPNADKLSVCMVDIGVESLQIVCGAPNVALDQMVPIGLIGATIPRNQHAPDGRPFVLSHVKIRGEDSFGMICSSRELDLGEDANGIMVLDNRARIGMSLAEYLGLDDVVLEIAVTPNRPDGMSHIGIAREISAFTGKEVKYPRFKLKEGKTTIHEVATVKVTDPVNCPRYSTRAIFKVKIAPSPEWLQHSLSAVGVRPINNVVDISNFVLMEMGHPLHAFDYDKLAGRALVVESAKAGEKFTTLDHVVRQLQEGALMIRDVTKSVAIAGVMGGTDSEISGTTQNVLLESAYFRPQSIRRTSKSLGLTTEASQRFERGADPEATRHAVDRAAFLIQEICGGEILKGCIDIYPRKIPVKQIDVRVDKVNELLDITLTNQQVTTLLKKLQITPVRLKPKGGARNARRFAVPSYRPDLGIEADIIEEVARIYGYNQIRTKVHALIRYPSHAPEEDFLDIFRRELKGKGMHEIVTNSMQEKSVALLASDQVVHIANPVSKDMAALRSNLIPGALMVVRNNIFHGSKNLRLFECGKVYFQVQGSPEGEVSSGYGEEERVLLAYSGLAYPPSWDQASRIVDIFDAKGELESLFKKISLDKIKYIPYPTTNALTEDGLLIEINGQNAGTLGVVRKDILNRFEIEQDVIVAELILNVLFNNRNATMSFRPLPRFPRVMRDIALVVDEEVPVGIVEQEIVNEGKDILVGLELFDIYRGDQIAEGKKSCAFALEFMAEDHTLSQEEVDRIMENIITRTSDSVHATLRT